MQELNEFYNDGFGWVCRHCSHENEENAAGGERSRLLTEGESEGKIPSLSTKALAKWADPARRYLICPQCGIRELVEKA